MRWSNYVSTLKLVISESQIQECVERLAKLIQADYQDQPLLVVGALNGSFIFLSDLIRHMHLPIQVDFIRISSYDQSTKSSGAIRLHHGVRTSVVGKNVLVIEDIVDSGFTAQFIREYFEDQGAATVRICSLLDKPARRRTSVTVDYIGFEVPDEFLVGYGLDYNQQYRHLRALYSLDELQIPLM
ncbi:hypoxanthine phosphoribosyltransferase [SAR202 cluster bacterium AC-409-J13_OGT_754m]|nr:hypoxanthine phosphoribosyltransferase [SAR202 cluster bacterium AC-409-J13_OGT_754m]